MDTLVLKNGTKYHGEFLRTDGKYDKYIPMVYFGPKNEESLRIVPVLGVERLQLKEGIFVINDGKINDWHTRHEDKQLEVYCDNHPDAFECRVYDD